MTFRTTLREIRSSRQISLIALPCEKYARRILAIVSTTSIPIEAPNKVGGQSGPLATGSRLDAHQPRSGVPIPCKMTPMKEHLRVFCNARHLQIHERQADHSRLTIEWVGDRRNHDGSVS